LTAVCEVPPPAGIAPKSPPTTLPAERHQLLVRRRPRLARLTEGAPGGDGLGELINAMPSAAGHTVRADRSGAVKPGRPADVADRLQPRCANPNSAEAAMAAPMARSGRVTVA
jgi:hypothetical protein